MNAEFSLLRVRPGSATAEGLSHEQLASLVRHLASDGSPPTWSENFTVPLNASPLDDQIVSRLADKICRHLEVSPRLLIDICYDRGIECYAMLEWIVYRAIETTHRVLGSRLSVVVLCSSLPKPPAKLSLVETDEELAERVTFIDQFGLSGSQPSRDSQLATLVSSSGSDLRRIFQRRVLRRRGVFASTRSSESHSYRYYYDLPNRHALSELTELLTMYLEERSANVVLFSDAAVEDWLEECIAAASTRVGALWAASNSFRVPPTELDPSVRLTMEAIDEAATAGDAQVVLILPAYRHGRSLGGLVEQCQSLGVNEFYCLSIFLDDSHPNVVVDQNGHDDDFAAASVPLGADVRQRIDFLVSTPIAAVQADSWEVRAARAVGELSLGSQAPRISKVGLWSLLNDYPVGLESLLPSSRAAVRWFPQFADLDSWDSYWIADALVGLVLEAIPCVREQLLLIMPDEPNGSRPIGRAIEDRLGVRVAMVPRDVLKGEGIVKPETASLISDFRSLKIVALDESSVTGTTFMQIDALVSEITGRPCDLRACVLEARAPDAQMRADVTLMSWEPLTWG